MKVAVEEQLKQKIIITWNYKYTNIQLNRPPLWFLLLQQQKIEKKMVQPIPQHPKQIIKGALVLLKIVKSTGLLKFSIKI